MCFVNPVTQMTLFNGKTFLLNLFSKGEFKTIFLTRAGKKRLPCPPQRGQPGKRGRYCIFEHILRVNLYDASSLMLKQ